MALTKDRDTRELLDPRVRRFSLAAGAVIHAGGLVALTTGGVVRPAGQDVNDLVVGVACRAVDNATGAEGDAVVDVKTGVFKLANSQTDPLGLTDSGQTVFAEDDETLARSDAAGTLAPAGSLWQVDEDGVWIKID